MPEINAMLEKTELPLIGIAAGSASSQQIAEFATAFGATFETIIDADRGFAQAVGARSTPNVYVVQPRLIDPLKSKPFELSLLGSRGRQTSHAKPHNSHRNFRHERWTGSALKTTP